MIERVQVRRLTAVDADHAKQAIRSVKHPEPSGGISSLESLDMRAWLANPSNVLITASTDDGPVGFALGYLLNRVDGPRSMLFFYEIEVAPSFRRQSIGRMLVNTMKRVAHGEQVLKMWVQTAPDNIAARSLYRSAGGVESEHSDLMIVWTEGGLQ